MNTHQAHLLDSLVALSEGVKGQHSIIPSFPSPHPYSPTGKQFGADTHTHTLSPACVIEVSSLEVREKHCCGGRDLVDWLLLHLWRILTSSWPCDPSQTCWSGVSLLVAFHPSTYFLKWFPLSTLTHTHTHTRYSHLRPLQHSLFSHFLRWSVAMTDYSLKSIIFLGNGGWAGHQRNGRNENEGEVKSGCNCKPGRDYLTPVCLHAGAGPFRPIHQARVSAPD